MPLMKVSQWIELTFEEGSKPTTNTVKNWIRRGDLHGEVLAGKHYVTVNEDGGNDISQAAPVKIEIELESMVSTKH